MEVYYNGEWGTVCDDGWDLNDAQVVCSELGLGNAVAARYGAFYGQGYSKKIWLDDLKCVGTEWAIGNCSHKGWNVHNCYHNEDASVKCATGQINTYVYMYVHTCIVHVNYSRGNNMYVCMYVHYTHGHANPMFMHAVNVLVLVAI